MFSSSRGRTAPSSTRSAADPVINMMEEQKTITDKGATMRLGSYECALTPGTLAARAYGTAVTESATGTASRSTMPTSPSSKSRRSWSAGSTRAATWWRSSSSRDIPGSLRCSSTPSSSQSPTGRIRSSPRLSRRR